MRPELPHTAPASSAQHEPWVDPASLPNHGDISSIAGNAPDYVKQLNLNTYISYGVGNEDTFGYKVGKAVKFVDISIDRKQARKGRLEATTVAELVVTKGTQDLEFRFFVESANNWVLKNLDMLNGAGMLHGGCVAYLIDK